MILDNTELNEFFRKFDFKPNFAGCVGIEREHFLASSDGALVPRSPDFLRRLKDVRWTYELSRCQVESRTKPHRDMSALKLELLGNANAGWHCAETMGLRLINQEVGHENMPLDVFPNPRYLAIASSIPVERLRAACRVTGTHIHIGVKDMEHALVAYNALIPHLRDLGRLGDHSSGERLGLYKTMAEHWQPEPYENSEQFFEAARIGGFLENPRNCWTLIRISIHGTVELRMFGVTDHADEIIFWVSRIKSILDSGGTDYV